MMKLMVVSIMLLHLLCGFGFITAWAAVFAVSWAYNSWIGAETP